MRDDLTQIAPEPALKLRLATDAWVAELLVAIAAALHVQVYRLVMERRSGPGAPPGATAGSPSPSKRPPG